MAPYNRITRPKAEPRNQLCTAKVTATVKLALQAAAARAGLPLSEYLSNILTAHLGTR